jgi:hypothetical protein
MRFDENEKLLILWRWWVPREEMIREIQDSVIYLEDEELVEASQSCIKKLEQMTDQEYLDTDFSSEIW